MKYVEVSTSDLAEISASSVKGITKAQKTEFFKLYTRLSKKMKKFVGRKTDSDKIQAAMGRILKGMRVLNDMDVK